MQYMVIKHTIKGNSQEVNTNRMTQFIQYSKMGESVGTSERKKMSPGWSLSSIIVERNKTFMNTTCYKQSCNDIIRNNSLMYLIFVPDWLSYHTWNIIRQKWRHHILYVKLRYHILYLKTKNLYIQVSSFMIYHRICK